MNEANAKRVILYCIDTLASSVCSFNQKEPLTAESIDQFRYIKIQPKTIDFNTRLLGISPTNSVVIPMSLVLRSIVLG